MGRERIQILDGGMGTTLESIGHSVSSDLWGSELLYTNPSAMQSIHKGYVEAGADLVETCTYQLTPTDLQKYLSSSSEEHKERSSSSSSIIRSSVNLVHDSFRDKPGVVFSCGPYGSTLKPGAEYSGIYPPPYGPNQSSDPKGNTYKFNYFSNTEEGKAQEENAIHHLTQFHLDKLICLLDDDDQGEVWKKINWIAFETIPLMYEIKAIRRCMKTLNEIARNKYTDGHSRYDGGDGTEKQWHRKKFWITCPFPNGQHPQLTPEGKTISIDTILHILLDPHEDEEIPDGIGINCTNPLYVPQLSSQFTKQLKKIRMSKYELPVFVLYPDGGQVYDVHTKTWSTPLDSPGNAMEWSKGVLEVVNDLEKDKKDDGQYTWGGVIVGGCCKTSFGEIKALKIGLDELYR
ncbi:hypothetical protein I203_107056 [Kwoniella mangroviensis CBS 8507]|uniref:hypothetical protein n=1 Tax=Kwoniella mangroviensis CBS 8507 TaxID=1296122 RepID=UPI00080D0E3D|nr:uncharacterized protein I203_01803 [Kwoniella mangroviensis CBS 8507]OCF68421.1 hypothetical protein I203_01803 [Kwoniella mangroviensis CBS 8507]